VGKPSLSHANPDFAAQPDDWDPDTMTSGSSKMLWWVEQRGQRFVTASAISQTHH